MMMTALNVADLSASQNNTQGYAAPSESAFSTHVTSVHPAVMHQPQQAPCAPQAPSFMASPSKNACMVRVRGVQGATNSRYRNDPYTCSVLPPLNNQHQQGSNNLAGRRLAPLPPSLHVSQRKAGFGPRADIARAQEFAVEGGINSSPDSTIGSHQHILPTQPQTHFQPQVMQQNPFVVHTNHAQQHHHVPHHQIQQQFQQQQQHQVQPQKPEQPTVAQLTDYQLVCAENGEPAYAMVRLKHEVLLYNLCFPVSEGDFVVLEGDRGENIGRIHSLVHEAPQHPVQCRVVRIAAENDIEAVRVQREKEEAAKHFAQGVSDALALGIRVIDTEFQTDGNKLTIYFTSRRQIDFRRLQRQMFKQYRCRIWLVNWADVVKAK